MRLRTAVRTGGSAVRAGFTLLELLVVVAILLVLTSVAVPLYMARLESAKAGTSRVTASMLKSELMNFSVSHDGNYPLENTWDMLVLEVNPPLDPWGRPFQWALRPVGNIETQVLVPVVWSGGPNGDQGPEGDFSSLR